MRVGIDEAGSDAAGFGVDDGGVFGNFGAKFGLGSCTEDTAVLDHEHGVFDDAEIAQLLVDARARGAGESDELANVPDAEEHNADMVTSARGVVGQFDLNGPPQGLKPG
jgi:hypothetical protein